MSSIEISLRICSVDDAPALAVVGAGTTIESFAGQVDGQSLLMHCAKNHSAESYRNYLSEPTTRAWFAVVQPGDAPVGYVMVTTPDLPLDDITDDDIEVRRIYMFARFHGTGGGRLLMDQAIAHARELRKKRVLLGVYAGNELALAFYYRNGFKKVGERKFRVGPTLCDDLILARELRATT